MNFKEINDILKEVANRMFFKDITNEEDVVLVIMKDSMYWGVVTRIGDENDEGVREVIVKLLSIPPLEMHFHINNDQLDGDDPFLINDNNAFIKAVDFTKSYLSDEMKEIYVKDLDEEEEDNNIKVPGSTSVN